MSLAHLVARRLTPVEPRPYTRQAVYSPSGLSCQVVWFDDFLWPDGPCMFRTRVEADIYIDLVLRQLCAEHAE